ncbi:hypothetical protein WME75_38810 [Sorangium sp. So ce1014]|uniref:hypothetical protein n=1 Tax=Sorangium sp. So ce1014 TaxID=3133326 RepID=UPI003F5E0819
MISPFRLEHVPGKMPRRMTKSTKILSITVIAGMLGAFAHEYTVAPAYAESLGSFCAAPVQGEEHCVSSDRSPADAWNRAAADGELPIAMWAKWPSGLTVDDIAKSPARLRAWLADTDKVLAYVRDTQRNAESYKASLARVAVLHAEVKARQAAPRETR